MPFIGKLPDDFIHFPMRGIVILNIIRFSQASGTKPERLLFPSYLCAKYCYNDSQ